MKQDQKLVDNSIRKNIYIAAVATLTGLMLSSSNVAAKEQVLPKTRVEQQTNKEKEKLYQAYHVMTNYKVNQLLESYPKASKEELKTAVVVYNMSLFPAEFSLPYKAKILDNPYIDTSMIEDIYNSTIEKKQLITYKMAIPINQFALGNDTVIAYQDLDQITFEVGELISNVAYDEMVTGKQQDYEDQVLRCLDDLEYFYRSNQNLCETNPVIESMWNRYYNFVLYQYQKQLKKPGIVLLKR